jgi:recombination protein RecT
MNMSVATTPNGQIVTKSQAKTQESTLVTLVQKMGPEIQRALPKHVTAERMSRIVLTALRSTKDLALCSTVSFLGCVMSCAQLGLEPNTPLGHAYLIPRKTKGGGMQCTLIIGYQGMIDLSYRSGFLLGLDADAVKDGDVFEHERGLNPILRHRQSDAADRETKKTTHAWSVFRLKGGATPFTVLSRAQIDSRRKRSAASGSGPWVTDFDPMAMKSAIRAGWKFIPKSSEIAQAIALDEAAEDGRSQLAATDPEVLGLLQAQGLDTDSEVTTTGEDVTQPEDNDRQDIE